MNASFINAIPDGRISSAGCFAATARTTARAAAAVFVTAAGSSGGRRNVTLTAPVRPSRATRPTDEERLAQRALGDLRQCGVVDPLDRPRRERVLRNVVSSGIDDRKVRERIDPRRERQLRAFDREFVDRCEPVAREDGSCLGVNHEEHVVRLGEDRFEVLEARETGIFLREENPIVGGERGAT
jgi:hypothetical protein